MKTGLVSVTFRQLSCAEVIRLAQAAEFDGIEWGGDIHVPHGDTARAKTVRQSMREAGLATACYGSYYRLTDKERANGVQEQVLETAAALGAPLIRVWAGTKSPYRATAADWEEIARNAEQLAQQAKQLGIGAAFEYHGGTLTETSAGAEKLLSLCPGMRTLWQPPVGWSKEECLASIRAVRPRIANLHVFSWQLHERLPLADKQREWLSYLQAAGEAAEYALLEFVQGDSPAQLAEDARCLHEMLRRMT